MQEMRDPVLLISILLLSAGIATLVYLLVAVILILVVRWIETVQRWMLGRDRQADTEARPLRDRHSHPGFWHGRKY